MQLFTLVLQNRCQVSEKAVKLVFFNVQHIYFKDMIAAYEKLI